MATLDDLSAVQLDLAGLHESMDTFWLLFAGVLVFFMQCGFAMLEAGAVQSKSTQNIMLKNLFDASIGGLLWWLVGYGITNEGGSSFMGITPFGNRSGSHYATADQIAADADSRRPDAQGPEWALVFFQFTFAAAASTIVSGAVAERAQLPAYVLSSSIITGFVYPVVAHWVWSRSGWLSVNNADAALGGVLDFAGSGVVHLTGGVAALAGAAIIGPRTSRFDAATGHVVLVPGHSPVLQVLGTFILWLGWYGFNAGSTLSISTPAHARQAARVVLTTTISACCGGIGSVLLERFRGAMRRWDAVAMCNGILAGLVSITAGCATVPPWAALIIGLVGSTVYRLASTTILTLLHIDDPLDAFAVHGACGMWGIFSCALFSSKEYVTAYAPHHEHGGLFTDGGTKLLGAAALFALAHVAWVGSLSCIIFGLLRRLRLLRVPAMRETSTIQLTDTDLHRGSVCNANPMDSMDSSMHAGTPYSGESGASASAVRPQP